MIFECPNAPDIVEVDTTISIGLCSEHDPIDADVMIDENGDVTQELIDTLTELYNAEAETVLDGE
jgi:hypothetical protein